MGEDINMLKLAGQIVHGQNEMPFAFYVTSHLHYHVATITCHFGPLPSTDFNEIKLCCTTQFADYFDMLLVKIHPLVAEESLRECKKRHKRLKTRYRALAPYSNAKNPPFSVILK